MVKFCLVAVLLFVRFSNWVTSAEEPSVVIESCSNGVLDDDEADVDCGSECPTVHGYKRETWDSR